MWSQQVLPPRALPRAEATSILPSVWCELSSSTRDQGEAGKSLDGAHLQGQPLLWKRVEEKRRSGSAQPTVGTRVCVTVAWTPFLLVLSLHRLGQTSGTQGSPPVGIWPCGLDPEKLCPGLCPIIHSVCVCRFPVPACADPAVLPLCISGIIRQTHLHPEQWLQCILVPAAAREPSPVSAEVLLRLR